MSGEGTTGLIHEEARTALNALGIITRTMQSKAETDTGNELLQRVSQEVNTVSLFISREIAKVEHIQG